MNKLGKKILGLVLLISILTMVGCSNSNKSTTSSSSSNSSSTDKMLNSADIFSDRDLEDVDDSNAQTLELANNESTVINEEGTYIATGTYTDTMIVVEVDSEAKVDLIINNLTITNKSEPAIYVKSADKVFISTVGSSTLKTTSDFTAIDDVNTDAVIFAKDDITLKGDGTLNIESTNNGISGKDDLKITNGTININAEYDGIEANNAIALTSCDINITTASDGLHSEYDEDDTKGYVYILDANLNIEADDDAIHATTITQIDGGEINITAAEGIEGTYIQINDGTIKIEASDDGINAANKSSAYSATIQINGGTITINMGQGDTDAIDANGDIYINGGTIDITANSAFDYDGTGELNGGTVTVNGEEVTELTNQMMGPGGDPRQGTGEGGFGGGFNGEKPSGDFNPGNMGGNSSDQTSESSDSI